MPVSDQIQRFNELAHSLEGDCFEVRYRFEYERQARAFVHACEHGLGGWFFELSKEGEKWVVECER